jgi:uncharacterized protein YijF (DUF1287 family)
MLDRRGFLLSGGAAGLLPAVGSASIGSPALVAAARRQIGITKSYDHDYRVLAYPGGDVPMRAGVCADVVVRAARAAWGVDLQKLVHEDMAADFDAYPQRWGLKHPDPNIDHRRVPNLETYWTRQGARLWRSPGGRRGSDFPGELQPGDILTWRCVPGGGPHVAVVSRGGLWPKIIQNIGLGVREDWLFLMWPHAAEAHFRWTPARGAVRRA